MHAMRRIKPALREVRRLARQYSLGISQEAKETGSLIDSAYRIAARLKYGVGPLYYSLYRFSRVPKANGETTLPMIRASRNACVR